MEKKALYPFFVTLGLLGLTSLGLALTPPLRSQTETGIRLQLPEQLTGRQGYDLWFCQSAQCGRQIGLLPRLPPPRKCPYCESEMGRMSVGELRLLPSDTQIYRRQYGTDKDSVTVQIAVSGVEQKSIHRPQQCIEAQGFTILRSYPVEVPLPGRDPLRIMMLETQAGKTAKDGSTFIISQAYAYWFVAKDKETPYHLQRLQWMTIDRIFRGTVPRWAYIGIALHRIPGSDQHVELARRVVQELYPCLQKGPAGIDS